MLRTRRLPGFRFELQAPTPADILPRLDVACFVGFSASGPLHQPVRISSIAQFEMIFGDDLNLAWDSDRGEPVYAYLAPAVRAFFRNGGRLAWIIRVAGEAQTSYFPLSSLLEAKFNEQGELIQIGPAYAAARSPGSWADTIQVSTSQISRSIALQAIDYDPPRFYATFTSPEELIVGDLLRLTFENGTILICTVRNIQPVETSPIQPNQYLVICDHALWFQLGWQHLPTVPSGFAYAYHHAAEPTAIPVSVPWKVDSPIALDWPTQDQPATIKLDLESMGALPLGSLLRVDLGNEQMWIRVEEISASDSLASPLINGMRISGQGVWWVTSPASINEPIDFVERLSFELWARAGDRNLTKISDLAFDARHPRDWDKLPTDLQLYSTVPLGKREDRNDLWSQATDPRFPLAGEGHADVMFVPLAMSPMPDFYLAPELPLMDRLTRDGLSIFSEEPFLDPGLSQVCVRDLINEADTIRYRAPRPRRLTGIHAVLDLEEVTLIVVPDAVHRGWNLREPDPLLGPLPSAPLKRPEWWHFLDCIPKPDIPETFEPEWGNFLNCDIRVINPPCFYPLPSDGEDTFTLRWESEEAGMTFVLEEATRSDFKDAVTVYTGPLDQFTFYGHTPGVFYYRVRVIVGDQSSDWSDGLVVGIAEFKHWTVKEISDYSESTMLAIQHAVLRLCAARGDLFAVFALPEHYREDKAIEHIHTLTIGSSGFCGPEEPRTLSYGAVYHPWLIGREENIPDEFRRTPPDGAVTGIIARRTIARGAWLAPANEFLKGVVALIPSIDRRHWQALQEAQINLIHQQPKGFTMWSNDTLTGDSDLRPIDVRRLLILLRRLALQVGATYVFEPNDTAFQRSVQRGFEAVLDDLFQRGAFAGRTAATSYQVVTDTSVNSPQLIDQGRFTVELKVAPSLPLAFITIRLVQTGDRTLIMQEV